MRGGPPYREGPALQSRIHAVERSARPPGLGLVTAAPDTCEIDTDPIANVDLLGLAEESSAAGGISAYSDRSSSREGRRRGGWGLENLHIQFAVVIDDHVPNRVAQIADCARV